MKLPNCQIKNLTKVFHYTVYTLLLENFEHKTYLCTLRTLETPVYVVRMPSNFLYILHCVYRGPSWSWSPCSRNVMPGESRQRPWVPSEIKWLNSTRRRQDCNRNWYVHLRTVQSKKKLLILHRKSTVVCLKCTQPVLNSQGEKMSYWIEARAKVVTLKAATNGSLGEKKSITISYS